MPQSLSKPNKLHILSAMASPSQREDETPTLPPQLPHFFIIILPLTLLQQKLKIPKKFVRKHGSTLLNSVFLEVPSGRVWQIDLTRYDNGEVWLDNGWKPFVECYSLSPGHLVAFRYEGNSNFSAFIYDVRTSEIDYRPNDIHGEGTNTPKMEANSGENIDDFDPQTPQKRKRTDSTSETNNGARENRIRELKKSDGDLDLHMTDFAEGGGMLTGHRSMKKFTFAEKGRSLQRASAFRTTNPFFKIFLQPSYIYGNNLSIPANFIHRHFIQKSGNVTLSTSNGRTWLVKYVVKMQKAKLYSGWKVFVDDNGLKAGNVCVFEMIRGSEVSFRVVIFRETYDENRPLAKAHRNEEDKDEQNRTTDLEMVNSSEDEASLNISKDFSPSKKQEVEGNNVHDCRTRKAWDFKSESPFFIVVMQRSYIHKGFKLNIPAKFMQRHFPCRNGDVILFTEDGRTWLAKYKFEVSSNAKRSAKFYSGWKSFAEDNGLKVGDVCVFELKKGTKVIFRVHIFQDKYNDYSPCSKGNPIEESPIENEPVKELGKDEGGHKDGSSSWGRPSSSIVPGSHKTIGEPFSSFRVVISAFVQHRSLTVPTSFAQKLIKNGSCTVKLQVADKFWPVKLIRYKKFNKNHFSRGWISFVKQNALQVGDACMFELINKNAGIIKVSISRVSS